MNKLYEYLEKNNKENIFTWEVKFNFDDDFSLLKKVINKGSNEDFETVKKQIFNCLKNYSDYAVPNVSCSWNEEKGTYNSSRSRRLKDIENIVSYLCKKVINNSSLRDSVQVFEQSIGNYGCEIKIVKGK